MMQEVARRHMTGLPVREYDQMNEFDWLAERSETGPEIVGTEPHKKAAGNHTGSLRASNAFNSFRW